MEPTQKMIERPYRSGALQSCLLCRQPKDIQDVVLKMARKTTILEIKKWLGTQNIEATIQQVQYFIRRSGIPPRKQTINPKGTYIEKLKTYIDELLKVEGHTFTLWNLNLRGPSWSVVTKNLHTDGLISSMGGNPRTRWKILASKDDIQGWYEAEVEKASQHRGGSL